MAAFIDKAEYLANLAASASSTHVIGRHSSAMAAVQVAHLSRIARRSNQAMAVVPSKPAPRRAAGYPPERRHARLSCHLRALVK